jgi:hypothetical protein
MVIILAACLVLAVLKALITALALAAVALLAFGVVFRPRQALAVLATLAVWALLLANPVVFFVVLTLGFVFGAHRNPLP